MFYKITPLFVKKRRLIKSINFIKTIKNKKEAKAKYVICQARCPLSV